MKKIIIYMSMVLLTVSCSSTRKAKRANKITRQEKVKTNKIKKSKIKATDPNNPEMKYIVEESDVVVIDGQEIEVKDVLREGEEAPYGFITIKPNYQYFIEEISKKIELEPNNPEHYNNRGYYYRLLKKYDLGLKDVSKALELDKEFGLAYSTLAEILAEKGDEEGFYKNFELALKYGFKLIGINGDEVYETRKDQERFQELLKKYFNY